MFTKNLVVKIGIVGLFVICTEAMGGDYTSDQVKMIECHEFNRCVKQFSKCVQPESLVRFDFVKVYVPTVFSYRVRVDSECTFSDNTVRTYTTVGRLEAKLIGEAVHAIGRVPESVDEIDPSVFSRAQRNGVSLCSNKIEEVKDLIGSCDN